MIEPRLSQSLRPVATTPLTAVHRQAVLAIATALAPLDEPALGPLLEAITVQPLAPGDALFRVGERGAREYFVLDGVLKSWVGDAQGREVTLAFHVGPGVLTPAIARVVDERSRVTCQALTDVWVAGFEAETLVRCMLRDPVIQRWGDAVLRAELTRRVDREWSLAALPAAQRLQHFRQQFPGLEARIAQHHIASYLGITPVSLSRLRAQERASRAPSSGGARSDRPPHHRSAWSDRSDAESAMVAEVDGSCRSTDMADLPRRVSGPRHGSGDEFGQDPSCGKCRHRGVLGR